MALDLILTIYFGTVSLFEVVWAALTLLGKLGIINKCGANKWHALIPCYGDYVFAKCAGRETEGKFLFITDIVIRAVSVLSVLFTEFSPEFTLLLTVILIPLSIVRIGYSIRVYVGLCQLFNKRRRYIWLLIFLEPVILNIWGWFKKYQPQWNIIEVEKAVDEFFTPGKTAVMEEGLTVNLEERTASELFNKKVLLRDIHMYIKPGSMVLLLGGSGAGKTTLLNAINGYEKAKAEIHLNGSNVYQDYKRMQYDIGFVPQQDLMRGSDTVLHTLMDAASLRLPGEFTSAKRKERVEQVMGIFGLKPVAGSMVSKLSGGQRKRLSIAVEFLNNPSLFILDEPDSGLDGVMARELMQQLRSIADQGKIVIVITHTPDRVIDLFDSVIVLAKDKNRTGRLAFYGSIERAREFFEKDTMEHIVRSINRKEEGGEGRADEFVTKYACQEVAGNV